MVKRMLKKYIWMWIVFLGFLFGFLIGIGSGPSDFTVKQDAYLIDVTRWYEKQCVLKEGTVKSTFPKIEDYGIDHLQ